MRGDHDRVAGEGGYSLHSVRPDAFNYVWDNSIEPVLEVDSGASYAIHQSAWKGEFCEVHLQDRA
jgi:hypothetical protein